jgi:predicted RNase H-like HicB family nuclease
MIDVEMAAQSRIRVEFFFDPEFELWHYAVNEPDLPGINGGGLPTLDEARQHAAEVIALALRSEDKPAEQAGVHVEYLPVVVG